MFGDLDRDANIPANGNPPNCTIDPNIHGNAVISTKEAIAELELEPNVQALHPMKKGHEVHQVYVDPWLNHILIGTTNCCKFDLYTEFPCLTTIVSDFFKNCFPI